MSEPNDSFSPLLFHIACKDAATQLVDELRHIKIQVVGLHVQDLGLLTRLLEYKLLLLEIHLVFFLSMMIVLNLSSFFSS